MPKNIYSDEFKADAVRLYETTEGTSYSSISEDLGIARGTLKTWVHKARRIRGEPQRMKDWTVTALHLKFATAPRRILSLLSNFPPLSRRSPPSVVKTNSFLLEQLTR